MKKLFLITDAFPYGGGEKTFIIPELPFLTQNYEVSIISRANVEARMDNALTTKISKHIKVINIVDNITFGKNIKYGLKTLFDNIFWKEFFSIIKDGRKILRRVARAFMYLVRGKRQIESFLDKVRLEEDSDFIVYSFWCTEFTVAAISLKKKYHNMTLITRMLGYDLYNERAFYGRHCYRSYINKFIDGIFFETEDGREYYLSHFTDNLDKNKLFVSGLGVMPQEKRNPSQCKDCFQLVSCSNVIPLKRVDKIVEALARIPLTVNIHWTHFGVGSDFDKLEEKARALLDKACNISYDLKGYVSNQEIMRFYLNEHVDCFITVTSTEGGVPVSILEALSVGIPIISTDVGGIKYSIDGNGILLSANPSVEEVTTAIMSLVKGDNGMYMRDRSYEIWEKNFNTIELKKSFLKILHSIER